jgi:DNA-binding NtrC family response regulator
MASRPLHPIVRGYLRNQTLLKILGQIPGPRAPIVRAMAALRESLSGMRPVEEAVRSAEQIEITDIQADPNLGILFFGLWSSAAHRLGRMEEMNVLLHRAQSLVDRRTPVELRVLASSARSILAGWKGELGEEERILKEAIAMMPRSSPLRARDVGSYGLFLAGLGRLSEIEKEIDSLARAPDEFSRSMAVQDRFIDAVMTGQAESAERILHTIQTLSDKSYLSEHLKPFRSILYAMQTRWAVGSVAQPTPAPEPQWTDVIDSLLKRDPARALHAARELKLDGTSFDGYNLIRAELSNRNVEAARRLLEDLQRRGRVRYLDEFFLARLEYLAGNIGAAARHFATVLASAEKYKAEPRLDLEMRLACEMTPMDWARLSRPSSKPATSVKPARPSAAPRGAARLIGTSRAMADVRKIIARYAPLDAAVLITGETGTGKELVAKALHEEAPRSGEPFVAVNCGAISDSLLESELFGYERGAFTGAERPHRGLFDQAGQGTIFLDEIGTISARLQAALLRVLEEREIRPVGAIESRTCVCRVVAATNSDLAALAKEGRFREDLLYRLRRLEIRLPPLRERKEDIALLVEHFLNQRRPQGQRARISPELKQALMHHPWSGNVRELRNAVERLRLMNSDKLSYTLSDLNWTPETKVETPDPVERILLQSRSPLRRMNRIRELFLKHKTLTRSEIALILGASPRTISRDLARLVKEGLIEKIRPTASPQTHYFVLRP